MPTPRTASALFRSLWDRLDGLREAKKIDPGVVSEKCGFARSTWFVYQKRGTIPFYLLERIAHYLGAAIEAHVVTGTSDARSPSRQPRGSGDEMSDYLRRIADELEKVPEADRGFVAGAAFNLVRELRLRPPEADAEQSPDRAR